MSSQSTQESKKRKGETKKRFLKVQNLINRLTDPTVKTAMSQMVQFIIAELITTRESVNLVDRNVENVHNNTGKALKTLNEKIETLNEKIDELIEGADSLRNLGKRQRTLRLKL